MLISDFFRIAFYCEEPHLFEIYDGQVAQAAIGSVPLDKCKLIALRAAHKFRIWPIYIGPQSSLYYGKVSVLYDGLRRLQQELPKRAAAGEDIDALAEETWALFCSIR